MMDKAEILRKAATLGVDPMFMEKDYALSWLLKGVYDENALLAGALGELVFKGGTAIRKIYHPEWRLSEDLDFTFVGDASPNTSPSGYAIKEGLEDGFNKVFQGLREECGMDYRLNQLNVIGRGKVIDGRVQYEGPFKHRNTITIDISLDEKLELPPRQMPPHNDYPDLPSFKVSVYDEREIFAEKVRSIIQRGKSRDYYDVWMLAKDGMRFDALTPLITKKCSAKGIQYAPELLLDETRFDEAKAYWENDLARLVSGKRLPDFDSVKQDLKRIIQEQTE